MLGDLLGRVSRSKIRATTIRELDNKEMVVPNREFRHRAVRQLDPDRQLEDYDQHADMLDDLHTRIDDLFRANGVEIAFPQRDLHVRSTRPLVEFLARDATPAEDRS